MANHSLSKMLITLPSHSVGLVIRIISFERGIWLAVKPFRGLLGPARLIIAGKEQMRWDNTTLSHSFMHSLSINAQKQVWNSAQDILSSVEWNNRHTISLFHCGHEKTYKLESPQTNTLFHQTNTSIPKQLNKNNQSRNTYLFLTQSRMPDPINIAAGHKANLSNPSTSIIFSPTWKFINCFPETSEESKQHSKEILEHDFDGARWGKDKKKNPANVVAGHKAYLNNPGTFIHPAHYCVWADRSSRPNVPLWRSRAALQRNCGADRGEGSQSCCWGPQSVRSFIPYYIISWANNSFSAVNNPRVSMEAKVNAEERLHELGQWGP